MDEDDLNCLKLHLGNRFKNSDSSDSAEDTETDEEYNLLKPIPIPADIIRERAIYRPPTPEENEAISNASSVEVQTITEELQLTSIDEEKQVFDGGHIFSTHLDMAKELIVDQQAINIHKDKLSPIFIQTLEKFKMKVENFKISMKIFNSKQFKSYLMDLKESGNLALEDKICIFDILLSNWFAFVMSECLMIIRISFEFGNDKLLIMYQAVGLIRGFGNIQEIEEKISKRNLKTLDELKDFNIGTLANIQMSNEEILKSLIPLQPKTKVPQKKNLKNMVEQEESFDECSQNRTIDMNIKEPLKVPDFIKPEQNAVMKGAIVSSATIEYSIPQTTASDEIQMNFDGQKIVLYHLGMAKDLVTIQQKIHYLHEKLPTNFVKILEKFKIEVEKFEKSMQIFSTENFMAMCTDLSLENVVALFENNIFSLEVLISIFYAFMVSECLHMIYQFYSEEELEIWVDPDYFEFLESLGNTKNIEDKISLRNYKSLNELTKYLKINFPVDPSLTNDEIIHKLSEIKGLKMRRTKKKNEKYAGKKEFTNADLQLWQDYLVGHIEELNKVLGLPEVIFNKNAGKMGLEIVDDKIKISGGEWILLFQITRAKELMYFQKNVNLFLDKLSLPYLTLLMHFKTKVLNFEKSMQLFNFETFLPKCNLPVNEIFPIIFNFEVILSEIYAFLLTECLLIIRKKEKMEAVISEDAITHSRMLIESLGNTSIIEKKIIFRNLIRDLKLTTLLTNDEILNYLNIFFPQNNQKKEFKKRKRIQKDHKYNYALDTSETYFISEYNKTNTASSANVQNKSLPSNGAVCSYNKQEESTSLEINIITDVDESSSNTISIHGNVQEGSFVTSNDFSLVHRQESSSSLNTNVVDHEIIKLLFYEASNRSNFYSKNFCIKNLSTTENVVSTPIQHNEIINQLMNEGTDNASNSILMLIMYSTVKIVSILNILQYSMKTFKIKYSTATLKTMRIHVEILKNISKFNNTLRKSSFKNLHQILEYYTPISRLCEAYFNAYILYFGCNFIDSLKSRFNKDNFTLLLNYLFEILSHFGDSVDIYEKIKYRNDGLFMKFAQTICSAVPLTRISISNLELLKKIATARKLQITEEVLNKLTTTQEQIKINENTIFFDKISSLSYIEFGNLHLDLSKIEKLTELQRNFHSIEEYPPKFVFEYLKIYLADLKILESKEQEKLELNNFIHKYFDDLTSTLSNHMLRILVSHFYSFFLSSCTTFLENLLKWAKYEPVNTWHSKLLTLLDSICPTNQFHEKLEFRNDVVYLKYVEHFLKMETFIIPKSSPKIIEDILDILKGNKIDLENKKQENEKGSKMEDQISNIKSSQIKVNNQEPNIKTVLSYKQVTEKNLVYPISRQMNETNQIANTPRNSIGSINSKPKQKKKDQISNIKPPQIQVNTQESNIKRVLSYKQVTEKNLVYPISKQMNETNQIANTPRNSFDSVNSKPKQKKKSVKITTNISNSDLKTGKSPITSVHGDSNKHTENIRATPSCKNIDNLVSVDKNIEINLGEKSSEHALIISAMPQTHSVDSRECILTCRQSSQCRVSTAIEHGGKKVMEQNKSTVCSKDIKNGKTSMNPSYEEDLDKNTSPSGSIHYTGENNVKSETENRMKSSSIYRIMPVIAGNPVRLMQYTNLKIISSLNILQYSITNFESKFSSATAKTVKDYLKILNCFEELNISMHSIFSGRERQEIQKFCEAISRVCLANSYAYILSQIYNFIESQKLGPSGKDNLFNELVKMLIKFHSSVEIYEKFKYRNDDLYMEIAKTVCPIVPITHIPFSNSKILESIAALRKFQIKKTVSASLLAARDTIKRIKHKQDLYNVLMISKFSEFDNLYFNVSKVAELLTLQREMCRRLSHPPKILFQYIKTFFEVLKKLEEEKYELQITSHVIKFLYCMDVIISEHILGILLSHFYSVFLSAYSMLFKKLLDSTSSFYSKVLDFFEKKCSIVELSEKLQFRNDAVYLKFVNDFMKMETFVVDKSSYEILMEIAEILEKKRSSVNRAKLSNFSTQMPNEILKDSKMVDSSCSEVPVVENSLSLMPEVKDTKIEIKSKNDEGFKTNKTVDIIYPIFSKSGQNEGFAEIKRNLSDDHFEVLDSEIKGNVNINSLLISCNSFEISAINTIRQILSNKNDSEIAYNSLMNQIEYANVKLISVMNILQYSISTFEHQLSTASYETMIDYLTIVHYIDEFNDLLNNVSSAKKLVDIRNFYTPISRVNNANSYAFLVSTCCDFIRSLECCKEEESKVLYNQILEIIEALGSLETIYEKLKFRDDNFYSILLRRICSNPVLHFPPGNSSILENFWSIKNSPLNETLNTFVIFDQSNVMSTKNKLRLERSPQFIEDENVRYLRNRSEIHILALMQCNIQYWKEYEHSAQLEIVNEGLKEFEKTLKSLEVSEIKKTELGTFVYKLVDDLDYVLSEHVRRIFISHFYSFLFVTCTTFFKSLPEIFSTICSPRQISEKLQFRNDAVFLKYREIFGMKKCRVMKPSKEILQDVWDIWNCYGTFFEQICGRNGQMFVTERKFFNNGQTSTKIVKNEFTKYRNLKVLKNEFNITPFGTEMLREMLSRGEKKGQNISFMYQTQNNEYEIKILNFDHKLYFHRTLKNVYLSIVQKRAMSNSEYINLGNEKKIFAKHKNNFHMKFEIPGNQKDECTFWTSLLYFSRDYEDIEIDSEFIKTLESFVYSKRMKEEILSKQEIINLLIHICKQHANKGKQNIKFHSFSAIMIEIIASEVDELITGSQVTFFQLTRYFKEIFLYSLRKIMEYISCYLKVIDILLYENVVVAKTKLKESNLNITLHANKQYFSLCTILEFLLSNEETPYFTCSDVINRKRNISNFLSWFDVPVLESYIPFGYIEDIISYFEEYKHDKIGLLLQKQKFNRTDRKLRTHIGVGTVASLYFDENIAQNENFELVQRDSVSKSMESKSLVHRASTTIHGSLNSNSLKSETIQGPETINIDIESESIHRIPEENSHTLSNHPAASIGSKSTALVHGDPEILESIHRTPETIFPSISNHSLIFIESNSTAVIQRAPEIFDSFSNTSRTSLLSESIHAETICDSCNKSSCVLL